MSSAATRFRRARPWLSASTWYTAIPTTGSSQKGSTPTASPAGRQRRISPSERGRGYALAAILPCWRRSSCSPWWRSATESTWCRGTWWSRSRCAPRPGNSTAGEHAPAARARPAPIDLPAAGLVAGGRRLVLAEVAHRELAVLRLEGAAEVEWLLHHVELAEQLRVRLQRLPLHQAIGVYPGVLDLLVGLVVFERRLGHQDVHDRVQVHA